MPLIDYADAGVYGLGFTIITTVNRSSQVVDWSFTFQRTVHYVFNNRDSWSRKLIKPHDVEGKKCMLVGDIESNHTPRCLSLNASEIR